MHPNVDQAFKENDRYLLQLCCSSDFSLQIPYFNTDMSYMHMAQT